MEVPDQMTSYCDESAVRAQLDTYRDRLLAAPSRESVAEVFRHLELQRLQMDDAAWRCLQRQVIQPHPLLPLLRECPYTRRAWAKPRGYAGDASLLDYLYFGTRRDYAHDRAVSALGKIVFSETVGCGAGEAVRERRRRIADAVDASAEARPGARVLSIASGFIREAALCKSLAAGQLRRWTCIDQDAESIRGILPLAERFPEVEPIRGSINRLLSGQLDPRGPYDLCYAAGLLDYLDVDVARLLVACLFELLAPGGRLLLANFAEGVPERAFMECVADWWLVYRNHAEMESLADGVSPRSIASMETYRDDADRMFYLDLRRA
jgi:SAM-dependent methyltransferase